MKMMLTFTLLMIPGALSFSVTGYTGGAVTITCQYDRGYTTNAKYFCSGQKPYIPIQGWCSDVIRTDIKDKWVRSGRFSLYDDTTASVFNVTITDLNEQDSDTYQCAVDLPFSGDIYTEVKLNVSEDTTDHKTSPTHTFSSSTSFLSSFLSVQSTLVTTSSSSNFAKIQSAFTSASPMTSSDSVMIMSLSVVLVLIIIGLLMLTVILCKRHQTAVTRSHAGPVNKERISQGSCDYTEIKDIRRVEVCSTDCPNIVYATAQFPTIPSGAPDTVYSTAQLPTIQSDSPSTVYAEVKQP